MDFRRTDVLLPVVGPVQVLRVHISRTPDILAYDHAVYQAAYQGEEAED